MAENSKIEWTLPAPPAVTPSMAAAANRLHIKPARPLISKMVIVFSRLFPAIDTRKRSHYGKSAKPDSSVNSVTCLSPRIRQWTLRLSPRHTPALDAACGEAIATMAINIKLATQSPRFARPAVLFAARNLGLIFFKGNADADSGDLHHSKFASHSTLMNMSIQYDISGA